MGRLINAGEDRPLTVIERRQVARCIAYGVVCDLIEEAIADSRHGRGILITRRDLGEDLELTCTALTRIMGEMSSREDRAYDRLGEDAQADGKDQ